jgi:hypothetical protein
MATLTTTIQYSEPAGSIVTSLGVPGPAGPGVPVGGSANQILAKIDGVDYNTHWVTPQDDSAVWGQITGQIANQLDLASALSLKLDASTAASTYQTLSGMSAYLPKAGNLAGLTDLAAARDNLNLGALNSPTFAALTIQGAGSNIGQLGATSLSLTHSVYGQFTINPAQGIVFPDSSVQVTAYTGDNTVSWGEIGGQISNQVDLQSALDSKYPASNPSGFIDSSALAPYLTSADAATTYAITARGLPLGGNTAQVLTKASNVDYSSTWTTIIPGDRYLTSSTTTLQINNNNKTLTIGTGLSYTSQQDVVIAHDANNHMHARVLTYNPATGVMDVDVLTHDGTGTFNSWTVNVGGTVPAQTVSWGSITGTISAQLDLQAALDTKLNTTTAASTYYLQTNPAGFITNSALAPYLLASTAASTYLTQANAASTYFTISAAAGKANLSGATFTGKVNFTPVSGAAGINIGIGGTGAAALTPGDLWIGTGSSILSYRDTANVHRLLAAQNLTNTFSSPQIIDTTNAIAALRVTQKGTGNAIEVEDSTTPDATRFVVDQFGKVGIGTAPDAISSLNLDANGLRTSDGINTAALTPTALVVTDGSYSAVIGAQGIGLNGPLPYIGGSVSGIQQLNFIDGSTQTTASSGGIPEAPVNGSVYGRQDATWVSTDSLYYGSGNPSGFISDAPSDGNYYVRKDGAWYQCTVVNMYDSSTASYYNFLTV